MDMDANQLAAEAFALEQANSLEAAFEATTQALALDPRCLPALLTLGSLHARRGERQSALDAFRRASRLDPDRPALRQLVASMGGAGFAAPLRNEVVELFDRVADRFDTHLVAQLGYRGHHLLPEAVIRATSTDRATWRILDLGCGTGLCGPALRPLASHLTGVDISPRILEQARARGVYDLLWVGDLVYALVMAPAQSCDLLISADVLGYIGALDAIFAEAARVLPRGGLLAFSVEALPDTADFRLGPARRFAYSQRYLLDLARAHGFTPELLEQAHLRSEAGEAVLEHVAVLRAAATTP